MVIAGTLAVVASLLTFPGGLPWMIGGWLTLHTVLIARGRPGWIPLLACSLIVLVKRADWPASLAVLALVAAAVVLARAVPLIRRLFESKRVANIAFAGAVWIAWALYVLEWRAASQAGEVNRFVVSRPVVCLGDSLTASGYPHELEKLISVPVIALAREGATTEHALRQLPALAEVQPQLVIVAIGGNDYVKGNERSATRKNLVKIIDACRASGAAVILVEIPRAFISDPYGGLERELARKYDLQLVSDTPIRQLVLFSPYAPPGIWLDPSWHLSDDGLHPNVRGNRHLARRIAAELVALYGESALK